MLSRIHRPSKKNTSRGQTISWPSIALVAALGAALAVLMGGCDGTSGVTQGFGDIGVDRDRIDFGRVFVGQQPIEPFNVLNRGDAPIEYRVRFEGAPDGLFFEPQSGLLPPNGEQQILVLFQPRQAGDLRGTLSVTGMGVTTTTTAVELAGVAVAVPDCEDGNGCTVDSFDFALERCIHRAEPLPCNDFNACTRDDRCVDGVCRGAAVNCNDGDLCTDDVCSPEAGCLNIPTNLCNDGNPCTLDLCEPDQGCRFENVADTTPCDDGEFCTSVSVCIGGSCDTFEVRDDGTPCDDGNPCTDDGECEAGRCIPPVPPPLRGEVAYTATVALAPDASANLIVDRNDNVFVGVQGGVAAIDQCGEPQWTNDTLGTPRFSAAVSLPGLLTVPVGSRIYDLETVDGSVVRSLDLAEALPALPAVAPPVTPPMTPPAMPPVGTSSTSSAAVSTQVLDLAVRGSGALVASVVRTITTTTATTTEGYLIEVNALRTIATRFEELGPQHATRVAIDEDESVVTILRDGPIDRGVGEEQVLRLGIEGVPDRTWTSTTQDAVRTDLAIGVDGEVLWGAGLVSIDRTGVEQTLVEPPLDPELIQVGSPVTFDDRVFVIVRHPDDDQRDYLLALTASTGVSQFEVALPGPTIQHSPAVDAFGQVYVVTADGDLVVVAPDGRFEFETELPLTSTPTSGLALTLTSRGFVVVAADDQLLFILGDGSLANSSWPRARRDNLSTSNR